MPRPSHILLGSLLLAAASPLLFGQQNAQNSPPAAPKEPAVCETTPACGVLAAMQAERDRLYLENQLREEKLRKELADSSAELQRIKAQLDLNRAKADQELAGRNLEVQKARLEMEEINTRLALETAKIQETAQKELAELRAKR